MLAAYNARMVDQLAEIPRRSREGGCQQGHGQSRFAYRSADELRSAGRHYQLQHCRRDQRPSSKRIEADRRVAGYKKSAELQP
eukprot:gene8065-158_t